MCLPAGRKGTDHGAEALMEGRRGAVMIRRNQAFLNRLNVLLDLLLVIAAYMLASWFWLGLLEHSS